jgi:uncharacterized protein YktA (UPF0223 family)
MKYFIDKTFFDNINTQEKSYILGFLYADGYNYEKKGSIKIRLHIQDEELLLKFRDIIYINNERPLYYMNNYCELVIDNVYMSKQLAKLGCHQAKSKSLSFPKFLNEDLISHFIRGVFDGDGCISLNKLKNGTKKTLFSIIGYRPFISAINEIITNKCNLNCNKLIDYKNKSSDIATLAYSGCRQNMKIREYLYKDAKIYLKRKYNKFIKLGTEEWNTYKKPCCCKMCEKRLTTKFEHKNEFYCYKCFMNNFYISKTNKSNNIIIYNEYCILYIKDKNIYFDIEDIDKVNQYKWNIEKKYIISRTRYPKKGIYLQRLILNLTENQYIRFKDGDPYNCRKLNLEVYEKNEN